MMDQYMELRRPWNGTAGKRERHKALIGELGSVRILRSAVQCEDWRRRREVAGWIAPREGTGGAWTSLDECLGAEGRRTTEQQEVTRDRRDGESEEMRKGR
eukprot:scaffold40_cov305-Pinguiococcus_pyrenoidosus.AAC.9